jgi:hypothetical protein
VFGHAKGIEEFLCDEKGAEGDAAAEWLAEDEDVGADAGTGKGEPLSGAAEAALDLVEDEEGVELVGKAARLGEELAGAEVDSALAQDGFDEDGAGGLGDGCAEGSEVIAIDELDAGEAGAEVYAVLILSGDGERTEGAAVIGATQGYEAVLLDAAGLASVSAR